EPITADLNSLFIHFVRTNRGSPVTKHFAVRGGRTPAAAINSVIAKDFWSAPAISAAVVLMQ
ncbi:MAG TPA: hypothetical protein VFF94_08105, partial [Novosphingobium sp.]|nr:hypothetical protein [Novosphingobium sp.]